MSYKGNGQQFTHELYIYNGGNANEVFVKIKKYYPMQNNWKMGLKYLHFIWLNFNCCLYL